MKDKEETELKSKNQEDAGCQEPDILEEIEIEQLCELASHYGVKTRLSRFRPSGNAKRVWQEFHLDNSQLAGLSEFLSAHREILTGDSFFSITNDNRLGSGS